MSSFVCNIPVSNGVQVNSAAVLKKRHGDFSVSYAETVETACLTGDIRFRKYARAARYDQKHPISDLKMSNYTH